MALPNNIDESFIVLGTSPGSSLDIRLSYMDHSDVPCHEFEQRIKQIENAVEQEQLEEAINDQPADTGTSFKAQFKLGEGSPTPANMMVASTMITEDKSVEELQQRFGELLDENTTLKETLKQNNDSMKEQFLLIASCQEDMLKTHMLHKEKFDETKVLVEKLRQENKKLKEDVSRLSESESVSNTSGETVEREGDARRGSKSGESLGMEFVTSPDDDTIDKLTAQLSLVEKQRRQVIVENEKLTWQKESLEHIADATTKERDELKEKLKNLELEISTKDADHATQVNGMKNTIQELQIRVQTANKARISSMDMSMEEINKRDTIISKLEEKVVNLQNELKKSQLKILELESVKLEFTKYKSDTSDSFKIYKDQMQILNNQLKEATTTVFQPMRFSISSEPGSSSDLASLMSNVKLYDRTMKHLGDLLNLLMHGVSESLSQSMGLVASLQDYKLDKISVEQFKFGLNAIKEQMEKLQSTAFTNIGQVKSTLSIFEGIFNDYNELLKSSMSRPKERSSDVEALTDALVARGLDLQAMQIELNKLKGQKDNVDLLKAQLDLYKSDFEAERESRQQMASEKETILTDFRTIKKRNETMKKQLEEVRKLNPSLYQTATSRHSTSPHSTSPRAAPPTPVRPTRNESSSSDPVTPGPGTRVVKKKKLSMENGEGAAKETSPPPLRFDCPVCDQPFKSLILLQHHVDNCLL